MQLITRLNKGKINHIAIWTDYLDQVKEFYIKYFNGIAGSKYVNPQQHFESYFITFDLGMRIELIKKPGYVKKEEDAKILGLAHIAFSAGSKENVIKLTEQLRQDRFTIYSEPRTTGDGYFESVILDPEGNLVEITI